MAKQKSSSRVRSPKPSAGQSKPKRARAADASGGVAPGNEAPAIWLPLGLAVFSAVISVLAFPGFDVWPLAFVCLVPLFVALDWSPRLTNRQAVKISLAFGFVGMWGGYYWVSGMLQEFSGFPMVVCILFASLLHIAQGGMLALMAWLYYRLRGRGWWPVLAAPLAHAASEFVYPMLFPYYYANFLHDLPVFLQVADLGGPLLVTAFLSSFNVGVYVLLRALVKKTPLPRRQLAASLAFTLFTVGYGFYRIDEVQRRAAEAPAITVGMPQVSMGIFEKRKNRREGWRRHIAMSREIEQTADPDLLIWPESAYTFFLPEDITNVKDLVMTFGEEGMSLSTPLVFGGLSRRSFPDRERRYNTAFIVDADGEIEGTYDKTYLLAFGEYLPFGEDFPVFYEWSPHSLRFTPGDHVRPLPFGDYRITMLVCYEDIIPGFVRRAVNQGNPHLLMNITNDAWFGDTTEPWEHLALAKLRAVEHHRYFVRSTNSGVSAIIGPTGEIIGNTGVFTTENLTGEVRMMTSPTLYQYVGDWPGWLALVACVYLGFLRHPRQSD